MSQGPEMDLAVDMEQIFLPALKDLQVSGSDLGKISEEGWEQLHLVKLRNWKRCSIEEKAKTLSFIAAACGTMNSKSGQDDAANPLPKAHGVLWQVCDTALEFEDSSEYGRIRHHCITLHKECLKGLQSFSNELQNGISLQQIDSLDVYMRLHDTLSFLEDVTMRWWRVLTGPKDASGDNMGSISCASDNWEKSHSRLLMLLVSKDDLSSVKNEFLNEYCKSTLCLLALLLDALLHDVCDDRNAVPPYDGEVRKEWITLFLQHKVGCKDKFTEANLGKQFHALSEVLKTLDSKALQKYIPTRRRQALDRLKVDLEGISKLVLTKADHGRFGSMLNKDWKEIELKVSDSSIGASGASTKGCQTRDEKEETKMALSLGLRTPVIAFGANWLLHHCRGKSERAVADDQRLPEHETREVEKLADMISNASIEKKGLNKKPERKKAKKQDELET